MSTTKPLFYKSPIVEGPMGYQMPEKTARLIEASAKGLPKDFTFRRIAKAADVENVSESDRTDISFITTDGKDRDGEVVIPKGLKWNQYDGVVTFAHNYHEMSVGRCLWMKPKDTQRGNGLIAKTKYPTAPPDLGGQAWLPSVILHMMQQQPPMCTGKSIGFIPLNYRQASREELKSRPEWDGCPIIDSAIGIEYAVAPVPANPEAQMESVSKGATDAHFVELFKAAVKSIATGSAATAADVAISSFVRPETIAKAVDAYRASRLKNLPDQVTALVRDELDRLRGAV
jgi:hypothetical protein